ncbi:hypothetical protein KPSB59_4230023 [Klebsiella quasipneumoniae subsp. quasipneumoniae]|nr:hypothetical protein KPSB59_4230023 [Klebsiella quasipneumoniae subsp. quasipneumoniae]
MEVISADRQASTRAAVMDFSRRFAVIEVPAYDAAQCSYAAQMELFSLGFRFAHIAPPWYDRQAKTPRTKARR